jgi:DNA-binding transcriptional regulator YiaG
MENTSRIALAQHIKAEKMKKKDFAEMLGVSASQLSRWLSGTAVPDRISRRFVEFATGISADNWK